MRKKTVKDIGGLWRAKKGYFKTLEEIFCKTLEK